MSEDGKGLYEAVSQVRKLFEEISRLLSTADALMREKGWDEGTTSSKAIKDSSAAIYLPKQWMPYEAFRFFKKDDTPHIFASICVILDDIDETNPIEEPLIAASLFDYGRGNEVGNKWDYWFASYHLQMPERQDDGTPISVDPRKLPKFRDYPVENLTTFALPLVDISDADSLKDRVIRPLLERFEATKIR